MKVIILAGGYATRLYPLTETIPKHLIKIGDKPLINYLFTSFFGIADLEEILIVTNDKFYTHFLSWYHSLEDDDLRNKIKIINDGTKSNETRLGSIGDIGFVIEKEKIEDDLMVIAGDNFFSEPFDDFARFAEEKNAPVLAIYDVLDLEKVKKLSIVETNNENQIISFEEKPENPQTTIIGIALYYYPREILPLIDQYIKEGNNKDQPGRLIEWFYKRTKVYTWKVPGKWFDVGTYESLKEAEEFMANKKP